MATISTAPTPFDNVSKEMLNEWLGHPVTQALVAALEQRKQEAIWQIASPNLSQSNETIGSQVRTLAIAIMDRDSVLEWIKGASRG